MNRIIAGHGRMYPLAFLFLLLSFLASCLGSNTAPLKESFESGRIKTVVAFGDSIVEGYGQTEGWPEMLGRELSLRYPGVVVTNAGVSGDTAADGRSRLKRDVLSAHPDMVVLSFGLNDMKNGVPLTRYGADLAALVDGVQAAGIVPVVLTTTRLQRGTGMVARLDPGPYNEAARALALDRGVHLIDVYDRFKGYNTPEYLMDVAHPNREGYRKLAAIVREGLVGD